MAHHASGLPTTTISADGVIYPPWYNVDDNVLWFQPAHGADVTQESPTIVGSSTRGLSGSPVQLSSPASTTRPASRSNARSLNPNPNPNPRATKKLRLHRTKVCAECKRSRTKCVLGDGNSCSRCDCLGVRCKLPTARRSHEKELKRMSGKLPRERIVSTLRSDNSSLRQELYRTKVALGATQVENAKLTVEVWELQESLRKALALTSEAVEGTATVPFNIWDEGTQASNGPQSCLQQQHFYGYDLRGHWDQTERAVTYDA